MIPRLLVVLTLLSSPAFAAPFLISDPQIAPTRSALREIAVGGSADGFLMGGLLSHTPAVLGVTKDGDPRTLGARTLGIQTASYTATPLFVNGRWIVPVAPDFLAPDRIFLAQVNSDGSPAGETKVIPWREAGGATAAWNGTNLLLASARDHNSWSAFDVYVRTASPDLAHIGDERLVASGVSLYHLGTAGTQFVQVYKTLEGLYAGILAADGTIHGSPILLTEAASVSSIDVVELNGAPAVTWVEGSASTWSYRIASLGSPNVRLEIAAIGGDFVRAFARNTSEGIVVVWNGVMYRDGVLRGREIDWAILDRDGSWLNSPQTLPGLLGGEVLRGAASSGRDVLLVWDRHFDGVGTPMWGALVSRDGAKASKFLAVGYARTQNLGVAGSEDGVLHAAWIEATGTGNTLLASSFDRDGNRIGAIHEIRSHSGPMSELSIATSGSETLLVWELGGALWGAFLERDGSVDGEPFILNYGGYLPVVTASPDGFFVAWLGGGGVQARTISGGGVSSPRTIAVPPPPTPGSTFGFNRVRIAAGRSGGVAAIDVVEDSFCTGIPCPRTNHVGFARFGGEGEAETATLIGRGAEIDVATDRSDSLLVWNGDGGIRTRLILEGTSGADSLLFESGVAWAPAVAWTGSEYTLAWANSWPAAPRITVATLSSRGELLQPMRQTSLSGVASTPRITSVAGEALMAWFDRVQRPLGIARAPVGEFVWEMGPLQPNRRRAVAR